LLSAYSHAASAAPSVSWPSACAALLVSTFSDDIAPREREILMQRDVKSAKMSHILN